MADFRYPPECEDLRREVRAFLDEAMAGAGAAVADPTDLTGLQEAFERDLHRRAGARGWLAMSPLEQSVVDFEVARADAPLIDTAMTLAGTLVTHHATAPAHHRLAARMAAGEVTMAIAYSEAGAGSDLAAIETTAAPTADGWRLRGRKVLVTGAHKADVCATIAVTSPEAPPRKGMSMFLVPMDAAGVVVVRHETMNGWDLPEVVFDDVEVGSAALLGERDAGWPQMARALAAERSGSFANGFARHALDLLVDHVLTGERDGRPLADDDVVLTTLGRLEAAWSASDRLSRRALWAATDETATGDLPVLGAMAKVVATELCQEIAQAATEIAGPLGLVWAPLFADPVPGAAGGRMAWEYLERVHGTIGAGTNEVQRDAIATLGLGLPRSR